MDKQGTISTELINRIRLHINRSEKQAMLIPNRQKWGRLTSALDVLVDTSGAIEYYLQNDYPSENKGKYLFTYGLLQALFVQEDAIESISQALFDRKIDFKNNYPRVYTIREMRNDVIGHPTNRCGVKYIFLSQISLRKEAFNYLIDDTSTGKHDTVGVDVIAAISDQAICINAILGDVVHKLDEEFKTYIEQHKNRKMKDIFHGLDYAKEKTLEGSYMGERGYGSTKEMVKKCEDELSLRYGSIDAVDSYCNRLNQIHEIYSLIDDGIPEIPNELQGQFRKYMLEMLFVKLEELREYCKETDEYFENYGEVKFPQDNGVQLTVILGEEGMDRGIEYGC